MKNQFVFVVVAALLVSSVLGCGFMSDGTGAGNRNSVADAVNSNKTMTDKAVDVAVGRETLGVPECDEVAVMLESYANDPDDNFVTKAVKGTFLNKIKESFRRSVEENKTDKAELAKTCKEFKAQLEKYKAEEASNSAQ